MDNTVVVSMVVSFAGIVIGIGATVVFALWQPKHRLIRGIGIGFGIVLIMSGFSALAFFVPVNWQSPIVLRSPIMSARQPSPRPTVAVISAAPPPTNAEIAIAKRTISRYAESLRGCKNDLSTTQHQLSQSKAETVKVKEQLETKVKTDDAVYQKLMQTPDNTLLAPLIDDGVALGVAKQKHQEAVQKAQDFSAKSHLISPGLPQDALDIQNDVWSTKNDIDNAYHKLVDDSARIAFTCGALKRQ